MAIKEMEVQKPGDHVKAMMQDRGWTQAELAYVMGVAGSTVNQIVNSKSPITPEAAKLLAAAFDRPAEEFADLQAKWSLQNAPEPDAGVRERAFAQSSYPLRAMAKRGWIKSADGVNAHSELCRFFGVNSLDSVAQMRHAARKTTEGSLTGEQLVWLYRVRQIAGEMMTPRYDRAKLEEAIQAFAKLRDDPANVRLVPRLLDQAGVRFVVVEALPGSKIDGVCLWLKGTSPVIGLTLRFDRIDNFWFVLRHECAHVLHGHGKDAAIVDYDMEADPAKAVNEEERIADTEAADFCVSDDKLTSFYLRKRPFFAEREVLAFAKRNEVHPGLVVGQLQRRMGRYDFLRKHLVKVRDYLAGAMMMDGWGDLVPVD
ncbi:MAG: helix-turn-helix domain-containing protein [Sphingomonas sp.]|nr:helix-turn-helix domain-containing protein [Sphingomonas sp.]